MLRVLGSVLHGIGHDPRLVAFARGVLLALATAALDFAVAYFSGGGPGATVAAAPVIVLALRYLEGALDKRRRVPPPPAVVVPPQVPPKAPGAA